MARTAPLYNALLLAMTVAVHASAQVVAPRTQPVRPDMLHVPGRDVTISLVTVGDGDEIWSMFGHTAIGIRDTVDGRDTVFNWGAFDMSKPHFILHFLQGLNRYEMVGDPMDVVIRENRATNRTVTEQELALTDAQKDSVIDIIRVNAEPQNVQYWYDYFIDNCATRPRDILDRVLGGQLHTGADSVTATSYRYHALRLMQGDKLLVTGVDIGLGEPSDRPITRWEEMFLPQALHDWVARKAVRDSSGTLRPLVRREQVLYRGTRPPERATPPNLTLWLTLIGVGLALVFLWLGMSAYRTTAQLTYGLWALACGLLGCVVLALSTVTNHRFARYNENLLVFNPLWLALVVLLPLYLRTGRTPRAARSVVLTLAGLSALALLAHAALASRQVNLAVIGLTLPPTLAIAFIMVGHVRPVAGQPKGSVRVRRQTNDAAERESDRQGRVDAEAWGK